MTPNNDLYRNPQRNQSVPGRVPASQAGNQFKEHLARPQPVPLAKPELEPTRPIPPAQPTQSEQAYSFIMDAQKASPTKFGLPASTSPIKRIGLVASGLLVLVIIASVLKGIIAPGPDLNPVISTVQQQHEILHVLDNASKVTGLTTINKNFVSTAQLAIGSSESELITYLVNNGVKLDSKKLILKYSNAVDTMLTTASTNNTYNQTLQSVMQSQLTAYSQGLKQAHDKIKGLKGRELLKDDYIQAQLLLTQLGFPSR